MNYQEEEILKFWKWWQRAISALFTNCNSLRHTEHSTLKCMALLCNTLHH